MFIPPQGFRHAAALLLAKGVKAIPAHASPESIHTRLAMLADDVVALADDMCAPPVASEWLIAELHSAIDRLPQAFDRESAKSAVAAGVARVAARTPHVERRDLFLVYVPEDRLPAAAPLAIELTKRRVTVGFAGFEVATPEQFAAAIVKGLAHHLGGVILSTEAFERAKWPRVRTSERLQVIRQPASDTTVSLLTAWTARLRFERVAK